MEQKNEMKYSYSDYEKWDDGKRWELMDGIPYAMSPAPSTTHQRVLRGLFGQLHNHLAGKTCEVFMAPFDVRLSADTTDDTVVQPDLLIVCDSKKIDEKGCKGAPDMVIEILSPSTSRRDRILKFSKYLETGVREYWIVDPDDRALTVHILKDGEYYSRVYSETEEVSVHILDDCTIKLAEVFPPMEPSLEPAEPTPPPKTE